RALRDAYAQAPDRHHRPDPQDGRLAHAARPAGWRRHRDQAVGTGLMDRQVKGILGAKLGMTQVWDNNRVVPVTVVQAGPCVVTQVRTPDKDGYSAVQLAYGARSEEHTSELQSRENLVCRLL